jgi:HK97 family phage portal protein
MTIWQKAARWLKGLTMNFPTGSTWSLLSLGGATYDYARQVGDGRSNSAVEACIRWIGRTFPESPIQVLQQQSDGTETPIPGHPLIELLSTPTPFYSGELLWRATLADWASSGNAYWIKIRNGARGLTQLWWAPQWTMEPRWPLDDPRVFISHYEYTINGVVQKYPVEDVVHFRDGLDTQNTRKGLSPIAALAREIFADNEASAMTAALLKNLGIPGVIISPEGDDVDLTKADAEAIKADFKQRFGGDNRGEPMVMPARTKVQVLSWSPEQMNLRDLRRIPEERVCAVLGIPPIVVGLGAGLDRSTFANMAEAREAAYESYILPNQRLFGADLKTQLLSEFGATAGKRVGFDTRNVRVLQEDETKKWTRVDMAVRGGWMKVGRAKESIGEKPEPGDDVYLRSSALIEVGPDAPEPEPVPSALAAAAGATPVPATATRGETHRATKGRKGTLLRRLARAAVSAEARFAQDVERALQEFAAGIRVTVPAGKARKVANELILTGELDDGRLVLVELPSDPSGILKMPFERNYELILKTTADIIADYLSLPIGFNIPDQRARDLIRQWVTRKGLVDMRAQTREAVMAALADGRAAGEGAADLAFRIRGMVEGRHMYPGVYREASDLALAHGATLADAARAGDEAARTYRATTIARTETKTAQNYSSVAAYIDSEVVEALQVWDGDDCGWTDHDDPDKANGKIVSFEEGLQYPLAHPRCVRSFGPVVRKLVQ